MSRTFLTMLHFDGTRFVGWQRQRAGRSVQAELERVLERLFNRPTVAHAAGRTDAGVHAVGLAASFSAPERWTSADLHRALNALLPDDCWASTVYPMRSGFHARKNATARRYRYVIGTDAAAASPFRRPFEWALCRPLDGATLRTAATAFEGTHDFRAFSVKTDPKPHYDCTVSEASWEVREAGRGLTFHVEANRFLYHMVRMMVGTMVDVGLGRRPVDDLHRLLARRDNHETSPPAPPQGLYFVRATYPAEWYAEPTTADPSPALHHV